ncbi:hypothetical protein HanRHA438_Chr14g0670021 [Helianthus annuus]|nr:hypothetical protein HanRHA438_Chr14g0670021 [Helianthus annuus]
MRVGSTFPVTVSLLPAVSVFTLSTPATTGSFQLPQLVTSTAVKSLTYAECIHLFGD